MSAGLGFDPAPAIAVIVFGIAIGGAALLVLTSARSANGHLANATARQAAVAPARSPPDLPRRLGFRGLTAPGEPLEPSGTDEAASQQIFTRLNEYYAANVIQGNTIFWTSLLAMLVGFAFIVFGLTKATSSATTAIVATVAGVFSQFIAATFLVALRATQQQSTTYAQTLVDLRVRDVRAAADAQSVALGLTLLNEISDDGASGLANQTRAALALGLIVKDITPPAAQPSPPTSVDIDVDDPKRAAQVEARTRAQSVAFDTGDTSGAQRIPER